MGLDDGIGEARSEGLHERGLVRRENERTGRIEVGPLDPRGVQISDELSRSEKAELTGRAHQYGTPTEYA